MLLYKILIGGRHLQRPKLAQSRSLGSTLQYFFVWSFLYQYFDSHSTGDRTSLIFHWRHENIENIA